MSVVNRGRAGVIVAIAVPLSYQVVASATGLGWGSDPDRDKILHDHFGFAIPQPASLFEVTVPLLIVVALCWALYAGYRWARWLWILLHVAFFGSTGFAVISLGPLPPISGFLPVLILLVLGAPVVSFTALLLPSTGSFLRNQRTRTSREQPAA